MSTSHHGLLIHVIFSTILRDPLIQDSWRDDLFAYMGGIARDHKATTLASGGIYLNIFATLASHIGLWRRFLILLQRWRPLLASAFFQRFYATLTFHIGFRRLLFWTFWQLFGP